MNKSIILLLATPFLYAANIYSDPSDQSSVISEIEPSHEYTIKTQDWVKITDKTTKKTGWAKLSEMKRTLSENSQWSYQMHSTSSGSEQMMHYKPYSPEDITKHIQKVHQQHKKIMSSFDAFWSDLNDENLDAA